MKRMTKNCLASAKNCLSAAKNCLASVKICLAAAVLTICTVASADETYKCKDAAGKITYSGKECKLMGLTSAGEVKGQASVVSVPPVKPSPPSRPRASAPPPPPVAKKPEEPKRRCFAVKGGGTRCNDEPEKTE